MHHTTSFAYRLSRLPGAARLDVLGVVGDDSLAVVEEAVDRLVDAGAGGLVLGLCRARIAARDVARLRRYAYGALARERVIVEVPATSPPLGQTA